MAREAWYWLASGLGWGAVNSGELLAAYPGGAEEIAADLGSEKLDELLTQKQAERLAASRPEDFVLRANHAETMGIATIGFDEEAYPSALRFISNPPPVLFVKGDVALLNGQLSIGMVGTRRPSAYGAEAVRAIGRGVALGGAIIISGLAAGLDSEAHKAALAVNGPTIACIAFGHDHCYPAANKKLMEVIERYGAVVSEYPLGTSPEKPFFLQRNRLIAGLSHGLCVVEARRHSGTMSTVNFATDYGRDVFAVPGSIFSELSGGTNAMIREGAYLAGSASDILSVYGIELQQEDPVETAAKQARDGRPMAAEAMTPWQQGIKQYDRARERREEKEVTKTAEELPGQQTLGEVMRVQLQNRSNDGPVSAAQAVDAFRTIQNTMPATADSEIDARNAVLDEMVAAVSDSVEIGGAGKSSPPPEKPAKKGPQPYRWDQVERLDKKKIDKLSPIKEEEPRKGRGKRNKVTSPLFSAPGVQTDESKPVQRRKTHTQPIYAPIAPVSLDGDVAAIEPVGPIMPVGELTPLGAPTEETAQQAHHRPEAIPAQEATVASHANPVTEVDHHPQVDRMDIDEAHVPPPVVAQEVAFAPRPAADAPEEAPKTDEALKERLKTLQQTQRAISSGMGLPEPPDKPPPPKPPIPREAVLKAGQQAAAVPPGALAPEKKDDSALSEGAHKALDQLGARPIGLQQIAERSGLSTAETMAALTELELAGLSRQLPGRQFVIMQ